MTRILSPLFAYIYSRPLREIVNGSVAVILLWTAVMLLWKDKPQLKRWIRIATLSAIGGILYITVLRRVPGSCHQMFLMPLSSLTATRYTDSLRRQMMMNALLFLPLGLLLPFGLPDGVERKVRTSVVMGAALSVLVESLQCIFQMGCCETDDVLMNTLGMLLGGCSYVFFCFVTELYAVVRPSSNHHRLEENVS